MFFLSFQKCLPNEKSTTNKIPWTSTDHNSFKDEILRMDANLVKQKLFYKDFSKWTKGDEQFLKRHVPFLGIIPPPPPPVPRGYRAGGTEKFWIEQKLDNFDCLNNQTWKMKVISNGRYWRDGGPIFILLGGENKITESWLQGGLMFEMAIQNKAHMFATEHRYYGENKPTQNLTTQNLRYLTVQQALEDVAVFIRRTKRDKNFQSSKVFVFGSSYSGNMATWMRLKYPELVYGAVASSAPLSATVDFYEYEEVARRAFEALDPGCTDIMDNALDKVEKMLKDGDLKDVNKVKDDFNLCSEVDPRDDLEIMFMLKIAGSVLLDLAQTFSGPDLQNLCLEIRNYTGNDYEKYVQFVKKKRESCVLGFEGSTKYYSNPLLTGQDRPWHYQTCNEFGYFQTSKSKTSPHGQRCSIKMYYEYCKRLFGPEFNEKHIARSVKKTNIDFGGLQPKVTRVISVNHRADPWHALGLRQNLNYESPVYLVSHPDSTHCRDFYEMSSSDSEDLKRAKYAEQYYVKQWVLA